MGGGHGDSKRNPFNCTKERRPYINQGKQDKHIPGTNNYKQELAKGVHKSILTADPHQLLEEGAGKGVQINANREWFDFGRIIGQFYDEKTGTYADTTKGIIHYDSKCGAHIVPSNPDGEWR